MHPVKKNFLEWLVGKCAPKLIANIVHLFRGEITLKRGVYTIGEGAVTIVGGKKLIDSNLEK